jgi:Mycothiol maleylpyruvate isomerase N-terminal domain
VRRGDSCDVLLLDAPVVDVRPLLVQERARLVARLRSLDTSRWTAATALPNWTVKDIVLHLLDDDLGRLSRDRDGDTSGLISVNNYSALVEALNAKNQRWVEAAGGLSRELVADLLAWSGGEIDAWLAGVDLHADATVAWASDAAVPMWFDLAREFTERWVHHQQLLDALGEHDEHLDATADVVLDTFVWAYPHQYRTPAPAGTTVALRLGARPWTLTRQPPAWELDPGAPAHADAGLVLSTDQAWRILTGADLDTGAIARDGPDHLLEPLLAVRAAIV